MCQDTARKYCAFSLIVWNKGALKSTFSVEKCFP